MSTVADIVMAAAAPLARLIVGAADGTIRTPEEVARALLGAALATTSSTMDLHIWLDDEARARQDAAFAAAQDVKFGPEKP